MELTNLYESDRAVSPVIGVILMVAITVILAAVIGTFVLGLGDQVQTTTPQAQFNFEKGTYQVAGTGTEFTSVTITHEGGDTVASSDIKVETNGVSTYTQNSDVVEGTFSGDVSAGSSVTIVASTSSTVTTGTDTYVDDSGVLSIDNGNDGTVDINDVGLSSGDTVRVIYDSPDSDKTSVLGEFEV